MNRTFSFIFLFIDSMKQDSSLCVSIIVCVHLSRCVGVSVGLCEALCGSVCIEGRLCVCVKRLHAHNVYIYL